MTRREEALARLRAVVKGAAETSFHVTEPTIRMASSRLPASTHQRFDCGAAAQWAARAERALVWAFPPSDPILTTWRALPEASNWSSRTLGIARGLVGAALAEVEDGYVVERLAASVRAETEAQLVNQARAVVAEREEWAAAAVVLLGGALELRLRRFVNATGAPLKKGSKGSIDAYLLALEAHRNVDAAAVYPVTDDSKLERWRELRNAAAHEPSTFKHSRGEVDAEASLLEEWLSRTADLVSAS